MTVGTSHDARRVITQIVFQVVGAPVHGTRVRAQLRLQNGMNPIGMRGIAALHWCWSERFNVLESQDVLWRMRAGIDTDSFHDVGPEVLKKRKLQHPSPALSVRR